MTKARQRPGWHEAMEAPILMDRLLGNPHLHVGPINYIPVK
jgi:hypothetical protein